MSNLCTLKEVKTGLYVSCILINKHPFLYRKPTFYTSKKVVQNLLGKLSSLKPTWELVIEECNQELDSVKGWRYK